MADKLTQQDVTEMVQLLSTLPPAKPLPPVDNTPKETCVCGHTKLVTDLEMLNTGAFLMPNDICKGCKKGKEIDKAAARIVCARCKKVVMRLKPATDKTGFTFLPGKTYHLTECKLCNPSIDSANIVEKTLWDRARNNK